MSATGDTTGFEPAIKEGLNSRYHLGEYDHLLAEADAHQDWFDRINKHTELHQRMGGLYTELKPINSTVNGTGIIIDSQQVFDLEDLR